ncbi:AAA family ATPase [Deinococcus sp. 6YEL10]|uniref:ATP-dependent nuclease n=1 Tax=Deinococcus sp. 6YEL10 TaxID=2745870 RepID=UPI001E40E74D|nr:AAA family ATPase [Deinococcus sp. 6YEL10]
MTSSDARPTKVYLSHIHVRDFRALRDFEMELEKELTIITGLNGSGKSSILHALSTWPYPFDAGHISKEVEQARNGRNSPKSDVHIQAKLNLQFPEKIEDDGSPIYTPDDHWGELGVLKNGQITLNKSNARRETKDSSKEIQIQKGDKGKNYNATDNLGSVIYHNQLVGTYREVEIKHYRRIERYIPSVVYIPNNLNLSKKPDGQTTGTIADEALQSLIEFHLTGSPGRKVAEIHDAGAAIEEALRLLWPKANMHIHIWMGSGQSPEIAVDVGRHNVMLDELSSGQHWGLMTAIMLANALKGSSQNKRLLILMDEPGGNMHLSALQEIRNAIHNLSKEHQVIYTTHSDLLIQQAPPGSLRIVRRTREGITCVRPEAMESDQSLAELLPLVYAKRNEILEHTLSPDNALLIVEGRSEYLYFDLMQRLLPEEEQWPPAHIRIINADSITQIKPLLKVLPAQINTAVLADRNDSQQQNVQQLEQIRNCLAERGQTGHLLHPTTEDRCDIEDVFDRDEFIALATQLVPELAGLEIREEQRLSQALDGVLKRPSLSAYRNHGALADGIVRIAQAKDLPESIRRFRELFSRVSDVLFPSPTPTREGQAAGN